MFATEQEIQERFLAETFATYDFRVRDEWDNGEFLTGATVDLFERGRLVLTEEFTASSEEPGLESAYWSGSSNHAMTQALSFAHSWVESKESPFEVEFAPFGAAWARETAEVC